MIFKSCNLIGVTGEYYVCAELCKRGILALQTPKNNPLFDVVAISADAKRIVSIQVKTMAIANKQGWKLNKQIKEKKGIENLFLILVDLKKDAVCDFYIYQYDDFVERVNNVYKTYIDTPHAKTGEQKKEVGFRWYDFKNFTDDKINHKNKWELLGFKIK